MLSRPFFAFIVADSILDWRNGGIKIRKAVSNLCNFRNDVASTRQKHQLANACGYDMVRARKKGTYLKFNQTYRLTIIHHPVEDIIHETSATVERNLGGAEKHRKSKYSSPCASDAARFKRHPGLSCKEKLHKSKLPANTISASIRIQFF